MPLFGFYIVYLVDLWRLKMKLKGNDSAFHAVWNATKQEYRIFKNNKYLITVFKYSHAKPYIN